MAELKKGRVPIFSPLQNTAEATGALAAVTDTEQIWDIEREKKLANWMTDIEQSIQNVIEDSQEMLLVVLEYQQIEDFTTIFETEDGVTMRFKPYNKEGFKFIKGKFDAGSTFNQFIDSIPGAITKLAEVPSTGLVAVLAPKYDNAGSITWFLYIGTMEVHNHSQGISITLSIPYDVRADLQANVSGPRAHNGSMSCQARTKKFGILIK